MALNHLFSLSVMVLASLMALASASYTPSYSPPVYSPSPMYEAPSYTPSSVYSPSPMSESPSYNPSPVYRPSHMHESPSYTPSSAYTPSPKYKTPSYSPSPVYSPSPMHMAPSYTPSSTYTPSPKYETPSYTPSPIHKPSPKYETPSCNTPSPMYHPSSEYNTPSYSATYKYPKTLATLYGVQGVIYCKSCYDFTPIEGAVAKISCEGKSGYKKAVFSMMTPKTDKNGYFLATFTPEQFNGLKPTDCKVYLESSPSYTCNIATNINGGVTGASLTYSQKLENYMATYNLELYSVPAFAYESSMPCEKPTYTPKPSYKAPSYAPKSEYKAPSATNYGY